MGVLQFPSACGSEDCAPCGDDCCCPEIGFDYCVMRGSCGSEEYGVEDCKAVSVNLKWKVPACILARKGEATLRYRVYGQGTEASEITYASDFIFESVNPEALVCGDEAGRIPRENWAVSPATCDQCTPTDLLLIAWAGESKIAVCKACQDELCDEECASCAVQVDCWTKALAAQKCGAYWVSALTASTKRFSTVVSEFWGTMDIVHENEGNVGDCPEAQHYAIADAAEPLKKTIQRGSEEIEIFRKGIWPDCPGAIDDYQCDWTCSIDAAGLEGEADNGTTAYSGPTDAVCCPTTAAEGTSQITIPDDIGTLVCRLWHDGGDDFTIPYEDLNITGGGQSQPQWQLDPSSTMPTYGFMTLDWDLDFNWTEAGPNYTGLFDTCFGTEGEPPACGWCHSANSSGEWFSKVTCSGEITTGNLVDSVSDFQINPDDPDTYDSHQTGVASCGCCYSIDTQPVTAESRAYYSEALIRFTNNTAGSILVSWNVNTQAAVFSEEPEECGLICDGDSGAEILIESDSITLAPSAYHDVYLYPDTSGIGQKVWVSNIGCEVVP